MSSLNGADLKAGQRLLVEHKYRYCQSLDEIEIVEVALHAVKVRVNGSNPHWVKRESGRCLDSSLDDYTLIERLAGLHDAPEKGIVTSGNPHSQAQASAKTQKGKING